MHESSLIKGLISQVESIARESGAAKVKSIKVRLGPFSDCSPEHFAEHFVEWSKGTLAEGARLEFGEASIGDSGCIDGVVLESVEVEDED